MSTRQVVHTGPTLRTRVRAYGPAATKRKKENDEQRRNATTLVCGERACINEYMEGGAQRAIRASRYQLPWWYSHIGRDLRQMCYGSRHGRRLHAPAASRRAGERRRIIAGGQHLCGAVGRGTLPRNCGAQLGRFLDDLPLLWGATTTQTWLRHIH